MTEPTNNAAQRTYTAYELIGEEGGVRRLVTRFYELMDSLPEAAACRAIHPESLDDSREKLFEYLTGWLGGPQIYIQKRGHPMLRRRHFIAPIGEDERDGWLICFNRALDETVENANVREAIREPVKNLAMNMQNRHAGAADPDAAADH